MNEFLQSLQVDTGAYIMQNTIADGGGGGGWRLGGNGQAAGGKIKS